MVGSKQYPARILVIENDPDVLNAINIVLGAVGFDVDVMLNGSTILSNQFVMPDMFIIDKQLPDVDGLDICRYLHSMPNYRNIPVIVISANRRVRKRAIEAGARCFIEKPFAVHDLLKAINESLDASK